MGLHRCSHRSVTPPHSLSSCLAASSPFSSAIPSSTATPCRSPPPTPRVSPPPNPRPSPLHFPPRYPKETEAFVLIILHSVSHFRKTSRQPWPRCSRSAIRGISTPSPLCSSSVSSTCMESTLVKILRNRRIPRFRRRIYASAATVSHLPAPVNLIFEMGQSLFQYLMGLLSPSCLKSHLSFNPPTLAAAVPSPTLCSNTFDLIAAMASFYAFNQLISPHESLLPINKAQVTKFTQFNFNISKFRFLRPFPPAIAYGSGASSQLFLPVNSLQKDSSAGISLGAPSRGYLAYSSRLIGVSHLLSHHLYSVSQIYSVKENLIQQKVMLIALFLTLSFGCINVGSQSDHILLIETIVLGIQVKLLRGFLWESEQVSPFNTSIFHLIVLSKIISPSRHPFVIT